jgi:hypothetical protein
VRVEQELNYAASGVSGVENGNSAATVSVVDLQSFNVSVSLISLTHARALP